jgi:hypothetical protein
MYEAAADGKQCLQARGGETLYRPSDEVHMQTAMQQQLKSLCVSAKASQ